MFRFTYDQQGRGQGDLLLTFGTHKLAADSYFFAVDRDEHPNESAADRVTRVLRTMLKQWRTAVEDAIAGATIYLPYDLGDEDTGWIQCHVGDSCILRPGRSIIEGYKVWPNAWQRWGAYLPDFKPQAGVAALRMSDTEVLASIDASLDILDAARPPEKRAGIAV